MDVGTEDNIKFILNIRVRSAHMNISCPANTPFRLFPNSADNPFLNIDLGQWRVHHIIDSIYDFRYLVSYAQYLPNFCLKVLISINIFYLVIQESRSNVVCSPVLYLLFSYVYKLINQ